MQTVLSLLSRIAISLLFVFGGVRLTAAFVDGPPAHEFLNMSSEGLWTSVPTRVDPRSAAFERIAPQVDPFPFKFRAGSAFKVLHSARFQVEGVEYQLIGAPSIARRQTCTNVEGRKYACGLKAFKALDNALRGRLVECAVSGLNGNRKQVQCRVNGQDVRALL
jgi:endonuclease YncB( thermonuclease family)